MFKPDNIAAWLPGNIRRSTILTAAHLDLLASENAVPDIDPSFYDDRLKNIFQYYAINPEEMENELHLYAKELLDQGKIKQAWQILLSAG